MTNFAIDPNAPKAEVTEIRPLKGDEHETLWRSAREVCGLESDNDIENWYLTLGGQFIRETGRDVFICDAAYSLEYLSGFCAVERLTELCKAGAFDDVAVDWVAHGTIEGYTVWQAGDIELFQITKGEEPQNSSGYFDLEAMLKLKNLNENDLVYAKAARP